MVEVQTRVFTLICYLIKYCNSSFAILDLVLNAQLHKHVKLVNPVTTMNLFPPPPLQFNLYE